MPNELNGDESDVASIVVCRVGAEGIKDDISAKKTKRN